MLNKVKIEAAVCVSAIKCLVKFPVGDEEVTESACRLIKSKCERSANRRR